MKLYKVTYFGLFSNTADEAFSHTKYVPTLNDARLAVRKFEYDMQGIGELPIPFRETDRYIQVVEYKMQTEDGISEYKYQRSEIVATMNNGDTEITKNSKIFFTA
jgi:hypothetical protein